MRAMVTFLSVGAALAGCAPALAPATAGSSAQHHELRVRWSGSSTSPTLWLSRPAHTAVFLVSDRYAQVVHAPTTPGEWLSAGPHHLGSLFRLSEVTGFSLGGGARYLVVIASDAPLRSDLGRGSMGTALLPVSWHLGTSSLAQMRREIAALALSDPYAAFSMDVMRLTGGDLRMAQTLGAARGTYTLVCADGRRFEVPRGYRLERCPPLPGDQAGEGDVDEADEAGTVRPPRQRPLPPPVGAGRISRDGEGAVRTTPTPRTRPAAEPSPPRARPERERPAPAARPAPPAPRPAATTRERPAEQRPANPRPARDGEEDTE